MTRERSTRPTFTPGVIVPADPARGAAAMFSVWCLDCGYAHDSAAATREEAIGTISRAHAPGHTLTAEAVDYGGHPRYRGASS